MTTWIDGSRTGDYAFTDHDGIKRYRGRTCNLYDNARDAYRAGRAVLRHPAVVYVWRTVDGLFDFSATPDANLRLPELDGAVLI